MSETKPTNEAFERFRAMTQRIVTTPKAKVDALAKKQAKRKQKTEPKPA